jgi:hypothetical protein
LLIILGDATLSKSRWWSVAGNVEDEGSKGQAAEDVHGEGLQAGLGTRVIRSAKQDDIYGALKNRPAMSQ